MSFLDKVTKAVGDVVDKGKKDVDQFMKIQKINGEIGGMEKKIAGFRSQIDETTKQAGVRALELMRAGSLTSPELQTFLDQVIGFEQQIAIEQGNILGKKADIERVKAEHEAEHAAAAPASPVVPTPVVPPPPVESAPVAPPPLPTSPTVAAPAQETGKFCAECGAPQSGGAFCPQCGAKVG